VALLFYKSEQMKKMMIAAVIFLSACTYDKKENGQSVESTIAIVPKTGFELDGRFSEMDSAVFVFYDDPFGSDSLRYTRFYKQHGTSADSLIGPLAQALKLPFAKFEKVKPCRAEGKVWLFAKGKIFQTVYFSRGHGACSFMYVIKDGFFYYMDIQQPMIDQLAIIKPLAKTP
jgi:hypothetical protein